MSWLILDYDHRAAILRAPLDRDAELRLDSTGFGTYFGDPENTNDRENHFWYFVNAGYELGTGEQTTNAAQIFAWLHEDPNTPWPIGASRGGGSVVEDLRLSLLGIELGKRLRTGEMNPNAVGDWLDLL